MKTRTVLRTALTVLVALSFAACGDDRADINPDAGEVREHVKVLARVGPGAIVAHPGDSLTLRGMLAVTEVGPVPDAEVTWRIAQDPGNTSIEPKTVTSESGLTENVLSIGELGTVVVRAESQGATSKAVWKIDVQPIIKHFSIVDTVNVKTLSSEANNAYVTAPLNGQVQLRVKVTSEGLQGEKPVPNESVTFSFVSVITGASFVNNAAVTQGDGQAFVILNSGIVRGTYQVAASSSSQYVNFTVETKEGGGTVGPGPSSCGVNDRPCPLGYSCNASSGLCEPAFGSTPVDPECDGNVPCPTGFVCQSGICNPNDPNVIDVTGHWFTKHNFDIRQGLPSWVQTLGTGIRVVDQIVNGQFNFGLPGWIQAIVGAIIQEVLRSVIPDQVYQVVRILDSIFTVFSNLRAEGEMYLNAVGSPRILSGTEDWNSFVFYFLPLCGGNISGNPAHPPDCARMDIMTTQIPQADISLSVKPFAARVSGVTIFMDKREVNMRLAKFLKYVLDEAMKLVTGDPSATLQSTLQNLIPCSQFAQDMANGLGFPSLEPLFDNLCRTTVTVATNSLVAAVNGVQASTDVLQFNGQASVRSTSGRVNYGDELGSLACERDLDVCSPADGWWKGKFNVGISVNDVPGRWRASRQPMY